jgi:hypothetical protein
VNYTTTRLIRFGFAAAPVLAMLGAGIVLLCTSALYPTSTGAF